MIEATSDRVARTFLSEQACEDLSRAFTVSLNPEPSIVFGLFYKSTPYGILLNVFEFFFQTLLRPQHVIE